MKTAELLLQDETYAVTGAAIEVHRELGPGFLEKAYQEAMQLELTARKTPFEAQKLLRIEYKENCLSQTYFADLVCYERIIIEIKALNRLSGKQEAQLLNYLKATGLQVGLIFNFGSHGKLERKRLVREHR